MAWKEPTPGHPWHIKWIQRSCESAADLWNLSWPSSEDYETIIKLLGSEPTAFSPQGPQQHHPTTTRYFEVYWPEFPLVTQWLIGFVSLFLTWVPKVPRGIFLREQLMIVFIKHLSRTYSRSGPVQSILSSLFHLFLIIYSTNLRFLSSFPRERLDPAVVYVPGISVQSCLLFLYWYQSALSISY